MSLYKPITEWMGARDDPYEQRKKLANEGRDVLVEEQPGEVYPMRRYRLVERVH